jgi:aspartate oxidase
MTAARAPVQSEMQAFDRALFRNATGLAASRRALDGAWREIADHAEGADLKTRETAALLATSRWSVASAAHRAETRGMHLRVDKPATAPEFAHRLLVSGFEEIRIEPDAVSSATSRAAE